jgi:hypothetical protein
MAQGVDRFTKKGPDYSYDYVRWTERRNIESILDLMSRDLMRPLTTHRFPVADAGAAYELIEKGSEPYIGMFSITI